MKTKYTVPCLLALLFLSCGERSKFGEPDKEDNGQCTLQEEVSAVIRNVKARKTLNAYDETGYVAYKAGPDADEGAMNVTIDYATGDDFMEGYGCLDIRYHFSGLPMTANHEYVYLEERWTDYRSDLSFHPLGLSIWVRGQKENKGVFRFVIMEDPKMFDPEEPHDWTRKRWNYYSFEDKEILSKEGWNQLIMPYSAFKPYRKTGGNVDGQMHLNRFEGYRIEIVNTTNEKGGGTVGIDNLEQLTSYELKPGKPVFTSMFLQPNTQYANEDWDEEFKNSLEIGIDTWIIQYAGQFTDGVNTAVSFYKNTEAPWITEKYDIIDRMFAASGRTGMKLIVGLYPGDYSKTDSTDPERYNFNLERDKFVFDELFEQYGKHPNLAGWYITEEFHDGSYPVGWQQEPALSLLANYLENVAAYIKTKSDKPVSIAPALWRGMPADICGQWFGRIFAKTPNIDQLYLQDLGGRCQVDVDVDLPNWFAEIKKACDANGVRFGVDIESFQSCDCPHISYREKPWDELKEQLFVAGLFTEDITNFSWVTFRKGTDNYTRYKNYLESNGLLKK